MVVGALVGGEYCSKPMRLICMFNIAGLSRASFDRGEMKKFRGVGLEPTLKILDPSKYDELENRYQVLLNQFRSNTICRAS